MMNRSLYARLFTPGRLPVVLQAEASECALACLAMIAAFHGHRESLAELRRRYAVSLKGTTLNSLIAAADGLGLSARPVRLKLEELPKLRRPCVLHWNLNHYVVLKAANRRRIVIHDPARGRRSLPLAEASKHFTGVAPSMARPVEPVAARCAASYKGP